MERVYQTYAGWKRAIKRLYPNATFEGDRDIASAFVESWSVGQWEGDKGFIWTIKQEGKN